MNELTYDLLMDAHKKMMEDPQRPLMTAKDMFFQVYFPDLNAEGHVIIASHLIEGVDKLEHFDWLFIDKNMTDNSVYAVKKEFLGIKPMGPVHFTDMFKEKK